PLSAFAARAPAVRPRRERARAHARHARHGGRAGAGRGHASDGGGDAGARQGLRVPVLRGRAPRFRGADAPGLPRADRRPELRRGEALPGGAPVNCDVLVVGGGPAGSPLPALPAEKGWRVTLLEKEPPPRFHIGESLLPHNLPIF